MLGTPRQLALLAALCVAAFAALLGLAYESELARWVDAAALQGFMGLDRVLTNGPARALAHLGDPLPVLMFGTALVIIGAHCRGPRVAAAAGLLLVGANVTTQILKPALAEPRYHEYLGGAQVAAEAFPSGHATSSMSLALAAVLVAPASWRWIAAGAGAIFAVVVSFSFVTLGWHFPSDVVGGYLVATTWALVALAGLRFAAARWPQRTGREAAKRAIDAHRAAPGAWATLIAAAAWTGALGALVLLTRAGDVVSYTQRHTAFVAVAGGVALAAAALLAAVSLLSGSRR